MSERSSDKRAPDEHTPTERAGDRRDSDGRDPAETTVNPSLPALAAVRPRATDKNGNSAVELRFSNGARIRYRRGEYRIREEWFSPSDTEPTRAHTVETPPVPDNGDEPVDGELTTGQLSDRALCAIGSYLAFDNRQQAAFSWGEENVAVLTEEAMDK